MLTAYLSLVFLIYATTGNATHCYSFLKDVLLLLFGRSIQLEMRIFFLSEIYEVLKAVIPQQKAITSHSAFAQKLFQYIHGMKVSALG